MHAALKYVPEREEVPAFTRRFFAGVTLRRMLALPDVDVKLAL